MKDGEIRKTNTFDPAHQKNPITVGVKKQTGGE